MMRIKRYAANHPLGFGIAITAVFILLVLVSSVVVSSRYKGETVGWFLVSTVGRPVAILILLVLLSLLGWLGSAGFTRLGRWHTWLVCLLALAYAIPASAYVVTGNLDFGAGDLPMTSVAVVFLMIHAFLEEIVFRGIILHDFFRAWGDTNRGVVKSVMFSSLIFGGYHLIYVLGGEPLPVVLLRIVVGFLLGIFLAALVLSGSSIYPAVFFHGILNIAAYLNLTSSAAEATPTGWMLLCLVMLPLAIFGIYLLRPRLQQSPVTQAARPSL